MVERVAGQRPNGRQRLSGLAWPSATSLSREARRLDFVLFAASRWRKPGVRRTSLPVEVSLKRLATDFLVFCMERVVKNRDRRGDWQGESWQWVSLPVVGTGGPPVRACLRPGHSERTRRAARPYQRFSKLTHHRKVSTGSRLDGAAGAKGVRRRKSGVEVPVTRDATPNANHSPGRACGAMNRKSRPDSAARRRNHC